MDLTHNDIKDNAYNNAYSRGLGYYHSSKVLSCTVEEKDLFSLVLSGIVKGSSYHKYRQYIEISDDDGDIFIEGQCSCPVGYNCKHVVAVCTAYVVSQTSKFTFSNEMKSKNVLDNWLNKLEKENTPTKSKTSKNEYFITYRLFGEGSYHQDDLLFYKSKVLKNGKLSQGTHLDSHKFADSYYYSELKNSDDLNIVGLTRGMYSDRYSRGDSKLEGTIGYIIVQELLQSGRCYFNTAKEPLSYTSELFRSELKLTLYKEQYTLKSNIDPKFYRLLNTKPSLILDVEKNTIQELDINVATYQQLLQAPKIDKKDIFKVYGAIIKAIPNINLKTPKEIKTVNIKTTPTPQIHLQYINNENDKKVSSFKIDFTYEENCVSYLPRKELKSLYKDDNKIEIHRDLAFEESAKNTIESFGFELEYANNELVSVLKDNQKQHQLKLWKTLLQTHLPQLEKEQWNIIYDETFDLKFEAHTDIVVENDDSNDWFSLSFNLEFNGVSQPIAPLVGSIIEEYDNFENMPPRLNIEVANNHFVEVQTQQIKPILQTIIELFNKQDKDDTLKVSSFDAHLIANLDENIIWKGNKEILELSQKLKDFKGIKKVTPSKVLNATLREYQQDGLNWLNFLYEFKFGGILADDMGLGKTIQTLAHLSRLKENNCLTKPSLIVMPTSLIANWKNEIIKFTPNLSFLILHGSERHEKFTQINKYDIILSTYPLIARDEIYFERQRFLYVILDEAQKIKNPKTKMTVAIKALKSEYRLALSGTPIENHLGELWSIYSFLMPGFLDTLSAFRNFYQTPIEKEHNFKRQELLNRRVKPFMIRRTKEIVAHELPKKSEIIKYTQFDNKQSKLYESIRVTMEEKVKEAVAKKGLGSSHITILDALLKLRQVCCDPSLLKIEEAKKVKESAKLELFLDLVEELLAEGRKILVFSQFTSMLSIIEEKIKGKNVNYTKLTGSTKDREGAIENFTKGDAQIFLISLKAGGVGLNLVEADTVIHYDPWWNPAVENQATDRAHRIGQTKAVFVYKLIVENTIEQKILELQERKKAIQESIYEEDGQKDNVKFNGDELLELLK